MAMIFMAELSRLLALVSSLESLAMPMLMRSNSCNNKIPSANGHWAHTPSKPKERGTGDGKTDHRLLGLHPGLDSPKHGHMPQVALVHGVN